MHSIHVDYLPYNNYLSLCVFFAPNSSLLQLLIRNKNEPFIVEYELKGVNKLTRDELVLFGERIRNRRNILHFTQEYVSEQVGISLRFYQMLERGEKSVSLDTLINLSNALNISIDYLLSGNVPENSENPLIGIFNELSQQQREDALKILQIYSNACKR